MKKVVFNDNNCKVFNRKESKNLALIKKNSICNRIKMFAQDKSFSLAKDYCIFDDNFRFETLFSKLEDKGILPILVFPIYLLIFFC